MAKLPKRESSSSQPGALVFKTRKGPTKVVIAASLIVYLGIVGLFYGGLWGYKKSLKGQIQTKEEEIQSLRKQEKQVITQEVLSFKERAETVQTLLNKHRYWTPVFSLLERVTLPQVQYKSFRGSFNDRAIQLEVTTTSFRNVARQILILQDAPLIEEVHPSSPKISEEGVKFSLKLTLAPDVWRRE